MLFKKIAIAAAVATTLAFVGCAKKADDAAADANQAASEAVEAASEADAAAAVAVDAAADATAASEAAAQ